MLHRTWTFFCVRALVCDELGEWAALCSHKKVFKETASLCTKAQKACKENNYFSLHTGGHSVNILVVQG